MANNALKHSICNVSCDIFITCNFFTGGHTMDELSVLDLQNLRHLIGGYETSHKKMMVYASGASDPQIKQFFQKSAQSAMQNKQQLMQFFH